MRQPAGQWVNSLAIILGGAAMLAPAISSYLGMLFINFLVVGAILGFVWPERSWRWGLWLAIPVLTLGLVGLANNLGIPDMINIVTTTAQAAAAGVITGLLGSKFSPRKLPLRDMR